MSKYAEKNGFTTDANQLNDSGTPVHFRKGSAGVLSPVFNSLVNAQIVYSGSHIQAQDNSYNNMHDIRLMPATTGGSMEQSDTESQPQRQTRFE